MSRLLVGLLLSGLLVTPGWADEYETPITIQTMPTRAHLETVLAQAQVTITHGKVLGRPPTVTLLLTTATPVSEAQIELIREALRGD